jgi:hypothetical protein
MAINGYQNPQPSFPSSGVGNIGNTFGPTNSSGAPPPPQINAAPQQQQRPPMMNTLGNIGNALQRAPAGPPPSAPPPNAAGQPGIHAALSQLHPQVTQALKNLPPGVLQQLHSTGMIHPALMQHVMGG